MKGGKSHLVAPAVAGGVDKPGDVIDPDSAQGSTPDKRGEAAKGIECGEHGHHVPRIGALDELIEGLRVQIACVTA